MFVDRDFDLNVHDDLRLTKECYPKTKVEPLLLNKSSGIRPATIVSV